MYMLSDRIRNANLLSHFHFLAHIGQTCLDN